MSEIASSNHHSPPAEMGTGGGGQQGPTPPQTGTGGGDTQTESPVSAYPELPNKWKSGLSMADRLQSRKNDFTEDDRTKAWTEQNQAVKIYKDELVKRWVDEMDALLVFAGLFSTVLTAFNVESYSLLSPSSPDPVLAALTQISAQLASFSVHDPFVNSTQPAFQSSSVSSDSTSAQTWAVWVNALWFSSLICSLSTASVAIMVKQWLHEYNSDISGTSLQTTRLRQHRYNGLVKWKVAGIIAVLPILLQIAFCLFLTGLLILLWNLNRTVAIVASALFGALLAFTIMTFILPTFTSDCAYLSPLSKSLCRLCRPTLAPIRRRVRKAVFSVYLRARSGSSLERISKRWWDTFRGSLPPTIHATQLAYVAKNAFRLDQDVFFTAYYTTGDLSLLGHASTCFSNHSIDQLSDFLTRIHTQNCEYGQLDDLSNHWTQFIPLDMASDMLLVEANSNTPHRSRLISDQYTHMQWLEIAGHYLPSCQVVVDDHRRISCALSNMAAVLYNDGKPYPGAFPMDWSLFTLKKQVESVRGTKTTLKNVVRRRVIAAIYTVLRTRHDVSSLPKDTSGLLRQCGLCLHILLSCGPPSASGSQPGDMAEEDTRWKPLVDAIAMVEDAVIRTLQRPEFRSQDSLGRYRVIYGFFMNYQDIRLEQLARRVSEKMLQKLDGAVQDLADSDLAEPQKTHKYEWLKWVQKSLKKERDEQALTRAENNETDRDTEHDSEDEIKDETVDDKDSTMT